ncbi:MAG: hypothetical protein VB934_09545 [Polyangiaceae bacterium]
MLGYLPRWAACLAVGMLACGCPPLPPPPPPPPPEPAWATVFEGTDLDRAVVSVWGDAPDSVFVVGGPLGNEGFEALALHYDGEAWSDLRPGGARSFWWVNGTSHDDVWMVGEQGRIVHYDGTGFASHDFATSATLWGVMAFSSDDVWVVGGTPGGGASEPNDIVLHYDGAGWAEVGLPGDPRGLALYKIWGTSSDDLYVVGEDATLWHKTADTWSLEPPPPGVNSTLFTVHGCDATRVYAVGGLHLLSTAGDGTWTKESVELGNGVNGVSCAAPDHLVLAGGLGLKQRLVDGVWLDEFDKPPFKDLHGSWAAADGTFWVVGGGWVDGAAKPFEPREGVVARFGPGVISNQIRP